MSKSTPFRSLCALVLALTMAFGTAPALAQSQASDGRISGVVLDSQGAAISGAMVKATNTQTGLERTVKTSGDGLYTILLLPPGIYTVVAEADGFNATTVNKVEVIVGRTAEINVTLSAGGVTEVVEVSAGAIQVQTTRSEADAVLNQQAIENLPINGRRFQDFVTLTPGAQVDPQRNQISLVGQRGIYGANVNVDGVDYNQPFFGGIRGGERSNNAYTIPQEAIKEFQVVAAGYSAEFGRSTGGIVNAVTKSGTNDFHGSAFFLNRPESLVRGNRFFDALEEDIEREVFPAPSQQQWGGSIGGPIRTDKIFFFGAYEQQRLRQNREVLFSRLTEFTPNAAQQEAFDFLKSLEAPFDQTNDAIALLGRVDYEINSNHRFNVRYNYSRNNGENAVATGDSINPTTNRALSNNGVEKDRTNGVVGQMTSFFSSNMVNELRVQFARETRPRLSNVETTTVETALANFGTRSFLPTTQRDTRFQIADNVTWTRGGHTIKFGGELNYIDTFQSFGFNQFGSFGAFTSSTETILDGLSMAGCPGVPSCIVNRFDSTSFFYRRQLGNTLLDFSTKELAFFAQDSWRVRPNFTLNFGLRWEGQFNPSPELGNDFLINTIKGFQFPSGHVLDPTEISDDTKQFGPRLGFAWDPSSSGKTVIRGYGGIYYARTPGLLLAGPLNNFRIPPGDLTLQLPLGGAGANNTVYKQLLTIGINLNDFSLDNLPVISIEQVQQIAAALGLPAPNPFTGSRPILMGPDYHNPLSYQMGIGGEHELARGFTLGADFTYVHTLRLERNRNVNLPAPVIRATDPAQRPFYGSAVAGPRPIPSLGDITIRESSAKSLYRALTIRSKFQRSWGQLNAFYTLSKNLSDDDSERNATGFDYQDAFNFGPDYNFSRFDRRHQFVVNPVFFLPYGINLSAAVRLLSGRPIDAAFGSDANGDGNSFSGNLISADRPYSAPGVSFLRGAFRNRAYRNVDVRVQKQFTFAERHRITFSAEVFNVFNLENIELGGSTVQNFCSAPVPLDCGFSAPTNPNFLQLFDQSPTSPRFGKMLLNNTPQTPAFQVQMGFKYQF
ncbi:MAG: carboxypeptidase regulatory-like domain-containing protein [Blastocatellia bacterium]|nr:carboxypeptidase regulatory-like domain-containing protein [Blastocatellia bacterium]